MDDKMMSLKELCWVFDSFVSCMKAEVAKGVQNMDTDEVGKVADIIKDLAEAKHHCWESHYYEKIVDAMEKAGDDEEEMYRHGYVPPKMGINSKAKERSYIKRWMRDPYTFEDDMNEQWRDGYTPNRSTRNINSDRSMSGSSNVSDERYGKPYREYLDARRHYTESKSPRDKEEMEMHANEHMMDAMGTIREIYKSAEPDLRKRMKADLTKLVGEMPT